jgi:hypothetical protein
VRNDRVQILFLGWKLHRLLPEIRLKEQLHRNLLIIIGIHFIFF